MADRATTINNQNGVIELNLWLSSDGFIKGGEIGRLFNNAIQIAENGVPEPKASNSYFDIPQEIYILSVFGNDCRKFQHDSDSIWQIVKDNSEIDKFIPIRIVKKNDPAIEEIMKKKKVCILG